MQPTPAQPAVVQVPAIDPNASIHITLLQLNDVYQITPVDKGTRGGLARVATLVKQIEAQNPNTLLVLAGDTLSPSIGSNMFQGRQMIDLWNQLGLDVATLGNHEFDFGDAVLAQRLKESKTAWVISNVIDKTTNQPVDNLPPTLIVDLGGARLGFFGLLTPDTEHASHPGPNVVFKDPTLTACEMAGKLRRDGADLVIAVTHLSMNEDKQMVRANPYKIALVMGGHEHTLLQSVAKGVPILKVGSDARVLGRYDLWLDRQTHDLQSMDIEMIPVTDKIPEDPTVAASVKSYEDQINAQLGQTIGETAVELDALQKTNRSVETNLGDFIADTFRAKLGADIALLNGGSIRSNTTYGPGPLTRRDVLTVLPFGNPIVKAQVTGAQIRQALENGVSRLNDEEAGRFPQVSGLTFTYDGSKPAGQRVTQVLIAGKPLIDNKAYTLATSSYLLGGGDDYLMLKNAKVLLKPEESPLDADIVQEAIQQAKTIAPKTDGRIKRLDRAGI